MPNNIVQQKGNFEVMVELIKVSIWPLIVLILLTCNNTPTAKVISSISKKIDSASYLKLVGLNASLEIQQQQLKNSIDTIALVNAQKATKKLPNDIIIESKESKEIIAAAKIIDTSINQKAENWVYLGQIANGNLKNTHFKINKIPAKGDIIEAKDAVYKRTTKPWQLKDNTWKLGDIRGVVLDNEQVIIQNIIKIEGDNYWALVDNE